VIQQGENKMKKFYVTVIGKTWNGTGYIDEEKNSVIYAENIDDVRSQIEYQGEIIKSIEE
jgi:hypothetical protein